jgi:hypothetical protein
MTKIKAKKKNLVNSHFMDKKIERVQNLNIELIEHLAFTGHWILTFCQKNNIHPPNTAKLLELIGRSRALIERMDGS